MFEENFAGMFTGKFPFVPMGGQITPSSLRRWGARSPLSMSGNFPFSVEHINFLLYKQSRPSAKLQASTDEMSILKESRWFAITSPDN